ncbi:MAG: hypothetical protein M3Y72_06375 [Acidobacteriota bacterium]|nr:hypothetical protein [Acidobacteriota bacterium]
MPSLRSTAYPSNNIAGASSNAFGLGGFSLHSHGIHLEILQSRLWSERLRYEHYLCHAQRFIAQPRWLPIALAGANEIAFIHKLSNPNQYRVQQMDSFFWSLPAPNVANIVNGYNAQKNGTLCHK